MKKLLLPILILLQCSVIKANDGAYFASGNQLIPIFETDISVQKEILSIKKIRKSYVEVTVYYEFFNPGNDKEIIVGFEAFSPSGDVNGSPKNARHPYMNNFTVDINNVIIPYEIAYVKDSLYAKNGKINSIGLDQAKKEGLANENSVDFYYVYHFKAHFKKGINIIKHTYTYALSGGIEVSYAFDYVLTAANRWANKQIDDFTLIIDCGDFEEFYISNSFFSRPSDWIIHGIGKSVFTKANDHYLVTEDATQFFIQKGMLVFQKKNFKPAGELNLFSPQYFPDTEGFDYKKEQLPFALYHQEKIADPKDEMSKKILKNWPFARRGYVFTTAALNTYFQSLNWYMPNPNYEAINSLLEPEEKKWVERWN